MADLFAAAYNPDVLTCLANLSNDEVFTPPELANQVLDMLPDELWSNPEATFLDPCCKTGVFLREIAKRLINGLKDEIPDLQERLDHIFQKQLYGIAITELTSLLSRRSLYCSKFPNGKYSVSEFDDADGNIRFRECQHTWANGRCKYCGASKKELGEGREGLETHAYEFIHLRNPEELFNMKFDVIVGNPPYQLDDGGNAASAMPIYQLFVDQALKLSPRFLTMIIPARWFAGGKGLDIFRQKMLSDRHITQLVDYPVSSDCFPGVQVKGGVCYFLWERENESECIIKTVHGNTSTLGKRYLLEPGLQTFIRWNEAVPIYRKIAQQTDDSFSELVSARKPFGLDTAEHGSEKNKGNSYLLFRNKGTSYIDRNLITSHDKWADQWKVLISYAYGAGEDYPHQIINVPFIAPPGSVCTETYLVIGPFDGKATCSNVISYVQTRFFRFLVLLLKNTQHATKGVYELVPMQDFSKPWTDEELYAKYGLTDEEIAFIESMIKPMDLGDSDA